MARLKNRLWTVVQHSASDHDFRFKHGLEPKAVLTDAEERKVREAGGLVFTDYLAADDYSLAESYKDEDYTGLIPRAPGTFSRASLDGYAIYVPVGPPVAA